MDINVDVVLGEHVDERSSRDVFRAQPARNEREPHPRERELTQHHSIRRGHTRLWGNLAQRPSVYLRHACVSGLPGSRSLARRGYACVDEINWPRPATGWRDGARSTAVPESGYRRRRGPRWSKSPYAHAQNTCLFHLCARGTKTSFYLAIPARLEL